MTNVHELSLPHDRRIGTVLAEPAQVIYLPAPRAPHELNGQEKETLGKIEWDEESEERYQSKLNLALLLFQFRGTIDQSAVYNFQHMMAGFSTGELDIRITSNDPDHLTVREIPNDDEPDPVTVVLKYESKPEGRHLTYQALVGRRIVEHQIFEEGSHEAEACLDAMIKDIELYLRHVVREKTAQYQDLLSTDNEDTLMSLDISDISSLIDYIDQEETLSLLESIRKTSMSTDHAVLRKKLIDQLASLTSAVMPTSRQKDERVLGAVKTVLEAESDDSREDILLIRLREWYGYESMRSFYEAANNGEVNVGGIDMRQYRDHCMNDFPHQLTPEQRMKCTGTAKADAFKKQLQEEFVDWYLKDCIGIPTQISRDILASLSGRAGGSTYSYASILKEIGHEAKNFSARDMLVMYNTLGTTNYGDYTSDQLERMRDLALGKLTEVDRLKSTNVTLVIRDATSDENGAFSRIHRNLDTEDRSTIFLELRSTDHDLQELGRYLDHLATLGIRPTNIVFAAHGSGGVSMVYGNGVVTTTREVTSHNGKTKEIMPSQSVETSRTLAQLFKNTKPDQHGVSNIALISCSAAKAKVLDNLPPLADSFADAAAIENPEHVFHVYGAPADVIPEVTSANKFSWKSTDGDEQKAVDVIHIWIDKDGKHHRVNQDTADY